MKIRIKFQKYDAMKFIGHLDMMRYFQKCMRLAGIDIAFSQGYSPHMIMSFASPLGVGATSDGDYMDIEVNTTTSSHEALKKLNEVMVEGVKLLSYRQLKDHEKNAMSMVHAAAYTLYLKEDYEDPFSQLKQEDIDEFYKAQDEILIEKKTKKGVREMNLKPFIYDFRIVNLMEQHLLQYKDEPETKLKRAFYLKVKSGSQDNVKPELVLSALGEYLNVTFDKLAFQIHRNELYGEDDGTLKSLESYGSEII